MYIWLINQILNYHLSDKKNPNQIEHFGREWIEILNHAASRSNTYIKICKEHYYLFNISKNGENVGKKLIKMVVNVEKLLTMVKNGDFSKFVNKWWNVEKCWWKH